VTTSPIAALIEHRCRENRSVRRHPPCWLSQSLQRPSPRCRRPRSQQRSRAKRRKLRANQLARPPPDRAAVCARNTFHARSQPRVGPARTAAWLARDGDSWCASVMAGARIRWGLGAQSIARGKEVNRTKREGGLVPNRDRDSCQKRGARAKTPFGAVPNLR
jgi:hypothetical protein